MKRSKKKSPLLASLGINDIKRDVFGIDPERKPGKSFIPWQWLLWGALAAFILGSLTENTFWFIVLAVAIAVILYFVKASQTVEKQVFLLTDERKDKSAAKPAARRGRPRKSETPAAEAAPEPVKATPRGRKPRAVKAKAAAQVVAQAKAQEKPAEKSAPVQPAEKPAPAKASKPAKTSKDPKAAEAPKAKKTAARKQASPKKPRKAPAAKASKKGPQVTALSSHSTTSAKKA